MYFGEIFKIKREEDFVVFAFRVGEHKVEEHRLPISKIGDPFENLKVGEWCGSSIMKIKLQADESAWIKLSTNVYRSDIYSISKSGFRLLKMKYNVLMGE